MGRLACDALSTAPDLELVGRYDPKGRDGASTDPGALTGAEVIVEFSPPSAVMDNLVRWQKAGAHCVVGTSGFTADRLREAEALFAEGSANCLVVPNFSLGAVLMMKLAEEASHHFTASEIVEIHHDEKADAPSGTAIETARRLRSHVREDSDELVKGARGADVGGVPVHSIRLPGASAHQIVIFGNPGEMLTIRHDNTDRVAYVPGILLAVRHVAELDRFTVGIESLL